MPRYAREEATEIREQWRALSRAMQSENSTRTWETIRSMRDKARAQHRAKVRKMRACSERIADLGMKGEF